MIESRYEKILSVRNYIISEYVKMYHDYIFLNPMPLADTNDITLDFISCTICNAKNNISKGISGDDYIMVQPCLRNNVVNVLVDSEIEQTYMSYFSMIGGFHYVSNEKKYLDEFNEIVTRQCNFLKKISNGRKIRLTIPNSYKNYIELNDETKKNLQESNCEIEYSEIDDENLKWKYGIRGIKGYGTRWEVQDINGCYVNCGNDIMLFNEENKPIGIDFGSGLETLISLYFGNTNLFYTSIVCSDNIYSFCEHDNLKTKLINAITCLICCDFYKKHKNVRVNYLINTYIRVISSICLIKQIDKEILEKIFHQICSNLNIDNGYSHSLMLERIYNQIDFLIRIKKDYHKSEMNDKYFELYVSRLYSVEKSAIININLEEGQYVKTRKTKNRR